MTIKFRFVSAAPTGEQYEISSGKHRAVVTEVGATLRSFTFDGRDVVRGFAADGTIKGGRGQKLIPWPNRIRDGRYVFNGVTEQLALTEPARHNASHGLARLCAVGSRRAADDSVVNRVRIHPQPGWPGTLEATITHRVGEEGLLVTVEATNHRKQRAAVRLRRTPVSDRRRIERRRGRADRSRCVLSGGR